MDPPPTAKMADSATAKAFPATASQDDGAAGRSRVYIACTLCRQRKIKCGGEQPACRNCTRSELICHYDTEPKRRGPDKKPGTRTRTRKNSDGTVLPSKSRLTRPSQTVASSGELLLVPSQSGPSRTKKRGRALRGPLPDQASRADYSNDQPTYFSNEGEQPSAITPPSLPGELGYVVSNSPLGRGQARKSLPDLSGRSSSDSPKHQLSHVQLPQLPPPATRALLDAATSSIPSTSHNDCTESPSVHPSDDAQARNTFDTQTDTIWPADQSTHPHTYRPSVPHASPSNPQGPQSGPLHAAQYPLNVSSYPANPGFDIQHTASTDAGAPASLPPASPVFSRLQHTHDPNIRPPRDPFAGLTYPRAGMAVPALGRGGRSPDFDARIGNPLDSVNGTSSGSRHLGQEAQSYATEGYGSGTYESYSQSSVSSNVEELSYRTPVESTYGDYSDPAHGVPNGGNYVAQTGRNYMSTPHLSYPAHLGYMPPGEPSQLTPMDAYTPRAGDFSNVRTPAEITILPPPEGGPLGLWNEQSTSSSDYDESVSGTGYISEVYEGVSDTGIRSTIYDESNASEAEDLRQLGFYRRSRDQFVQPRRMFYSNNTSGPAMSWLSEPSTKFMRQTWWDGLLEMYAPTKTEAAKQITSDLKYLFKTTNYWMSFFNVGLFMSNYNHRERRENIQPSLILAALAYSTFTQSSEIERAQEGRSKAMVLRDHSQSALEASLNSQRLDPTLAQAAWLLALFEISAHPEHSSERSRSALSFLDSIIRLLGLTTLDVMDPQASVFSPGNVPRLPLSPKHIGPSPAEQLQLSAQGKSIAPATCACHALSIACTTSHSQLTPFWISSPGWDPSWIESEIRREESRRLVWSALTLAAGFTAHDAAFAKDPTELHLIDASNYALCFPAEVMLRGQPNLVHSPQESVWALYGRAMLLWNSCLLLRKSAERMTEAQRAEFAVNVWLETNTIEEALNRHTCAFERNSLFQGREYLFNTRMFISWEFRRYIPSPDTEVHQQFHRRKAEEWLRHQAEVAKRLMQGLHTVTGLSSNVLGKRPYFVWWFMAQVSRCLSLWQCDQSLLIALEVARAFLPPIDYLTCLWPCEPQRKRYYEIRQRLHNECLKYGLEPPPPPQLVIPTAML